MADETASHGREFLSVCIRLLDFISDPSMKPQTREVLMAVTDLDRITGEDITLTIQKSLNELKINLADCRGQAYDTTRSMSSDKKGVQAHIQKIPRDAEYQRLLPPFLKSSDLSCMQNCIYSKYDGFL